MICDLFYLARRTAPITTNGVTVKSANIARVAAKAPIGNPVVL